MKKVLLVLSFLILLIGIEVEAKEPTLCDRNSMENYGVNKHWQITSKNKQNALNAPCVDASEKIYDFAGVLTDEEYERLQTEINEYIKKTNMDLVFVIANVPYYTDSQNEDYAADFYDYNDFGINFDKYSGTLFFRNVYESDPYYDIYTFGNAQLYYDYNKLQVILDGVYNNIHNGNYEKGFSQVINYLDRYYEKGKSTTEYEVDENGVLYVKYKYPWQFILIVSAGITLIIMIILVKKNKMIYKATEAHEYQSKAKITNRVDQLTSTHTSSYRISSSSSGGSFHGSGGGGFHSSIGSSGGGHSSGGGRHG